MTGLFTFTHTVWAQASLFSSSQDSYLILVLETGIWGHALLLSSFAVISLVMLCSNSVNRAYRTGTEQAFTQLPSRLDSEGLNELKHWPDGKSDPGLPLRRSLRVGLVSGRGGLLLSKGAALAAWEARQSAYRMWPRAMLGVGLVSLVLGLLAAVNSLRPALEVWHLNALANREPDYVQLATTFKHAHALLIWGLTNFFVALLLYFVFERIIRWCLDRTTFVFMRYLELAADIDSGGVSGREGKEKTVERDVTVSAHRV